jgi:hypothetical protein
MSHLVRRDAHRASWLIRCITLCSGESILGVAEDLSLSLRDRFPTASKKQWVLSRPRVPAER